MTTYNLPTELIREALQSITQLSLNKRDREIILIDDGSDISPLNDMIDTRDDIVYVRQVNKGLSEARNIGLRVATGKYIQFLDGDDFLLRSPYEHCLDIMRYHQPDMVVFSYSRKTDVKTPFTFEGPMQGREYMLHHQMKAPVCWYIFRRQVLGSLRFTKGSTTEDEEFTPQLLLRCEVVYVTNAKAYYYRKRPGSLTEDKSADYRQRRLQDVEGVIYQLRYLAERGTEADRQALNRRIAQLTAEFLYNIIRFTHDSKQLEETIGRLRDKGLFPLPDKHYGRFYRIFRKMISNKIGRKILLLTVGRL